MQTDSPSTAQESTGTFVAPHPGSKAMPRWDTGTLLDAPRFTWRNWVLMLGPGLVAGGSAIGGGEWLLGPRVTAVYGGALLWLATVSILGQVIYNIEISRYTLYSGEPIFTGKFRTPPGPIFWLFAYLLLDFGTIFPYLAVNAAMPVGTLIKGGVVPNPGPGDWWLGHNPDWWLMKSLAVGVFLLGMVPLLFGGKVYNSLKVLMTFKVFVVLGFLTLTAVLYSHAPAWTEIVTGFFRFGTVPTTRSVETEETSAKVPPVPGGQAASSAPTATAPTQPKPGQVDNVFVALWEGRPLNGALDFTLIAYIAALAAIAGNGGLTNTPISNYTRDQGWGMGHHVGAIPSMIGGRNIQLSHVGCVFDASGENLPRWKRWYRHVVRDQLALWMPACFIGIALPSMLSVEFLPRGFQVTNEWSTSVMAAGAVHDRVSDTSGAAVATIFWFMVIFCGFLVLAPSVASTADGFIRRWVDVFWTSSGRLRELEPGQIKKVYFYVLAGFTLFGTTMLCLNKPDGLITFSTMMYNLALGFSCWHTLILNSLLLPKPLRPGWFVRIALAFSGLYFLTLGTITVLSKLDVFK
jgi:hypothetical protein